MCCLPGYFSFFFFNDTATTEIYTLSLHDALPIYLELAEKLDAIRPDLAIVGFKRLVLSLQARDLYEDESLEADNREIGDRKSTRLNSSHLGISYAVFCLKKKKPTTKRAIIPDNTR